MQWIINRTNLKVYLLRELFVKLVKLVSLNNFVIFNKVNKPTVVSLKSKDSINDFQLY